MVSDFQSLCYQFLVLVLLAFPTACITWTVVQTELFKDFREWLQIVTKYDYWEAVKQSEPLILGEQTWKDWVLYKLGYLPTCCYCTSHYVSIVVLLLAPTRLYGSGFNGYVIAWFTLVSLANINLSLFQLLRVRVRHAQASANYEERRQP